VEEVGSLSECVPIDLHDLLLGALSPAFYLLSVEFNVNMAEASGLLV
jgi:hypothetical protein